MVFLKTKSLLLHLQLILHSMLRFYMLFYLLDLYLQCVHPPCGCETLFRCYFKKLIACKFF